MKNYQYPNSDILENIIIKLEGYFYVHFSGQRHIGLETKISATSPGTMVHAIHVLFVVFAAF